MSNTPQRANLFTRFARSWRLMSSLDRWDIRRYMIGSIWGLLFLLFTPTAMRAVIPEWCVVVLMIVVMVGGVVAAVGRYLNEHLWLELPGVVGFLCGWAFYLVANIVLAIFAGTNIAQIALILYVMTFPVERLRWLLPKWLEALR